MCLFLLPAPTALGSVLPSVGIGSLLWGPESCPFRRRSQDGAGGGPEGELPEGKPPPSLLSTSGPEKPLFCRGERLFSEISLSPLWLYLPQKNREGTLGCLGGTCLRCLPEPLEVDLCVSSGGGSGCFRDRVQWGAPRRVQVLPLPGGWWRLLLPAAGCLSPSVEGCLLALAPEVSRHSQVDPVLQGTKPH